MDVSHVLRVPDGPLGLSKGRRYALPFQAFPPVISPARRALVGALPRAACWGATLPMPPKNGALPCDLRDFTSCDLCGGSSRPCDLRQAPRLCDEHRGLSAPLEPDQGARPPDHAGSSGARMLMTGAVKARQAPATQNV